VATLKNLNLKILSMQDIKLAQMKTEASFLELMVQAVGVAQILRSTTPARDGTILFFA
jgi:hypothetical protein